MLRKVKSWFYTINLTVLLTINLFLIIAFVLVSVAGVVALGSTMGVFDWMRFLTPASISIVVYAIAILIGISMVVMIRKVILDPVLTMVHAMQQLAAGDFSVRMNCTGGIRPIELREFSEAFNTAAEELGSTEILRKDFINNFSHEFKTPITSLGGFADLLLEDDEMPVEERRQYLSIISSESHRLANLANSVLALSRVEAQAILTDTEPFPLAEQLRQTALLMEQKWQSRKKVALTVDIPEGDECILNGNEALLKEVWVNLLDNAFKFSPEGETVHLTLQSSPDTVTVTVADHGSGMDEATKAHIFDQFYQGDTSHKTEGNGLGLAMVQKITSLHKGSITVDTAPGQGSAFTVQLPRLSR